MDDFQVFVQVYVVNEEDVIVEVNGIKGVYYFV